MKQRSSAAVAVDAHASRNHIPGKSTCTPTNAATSLSGASSHSHGSINNSPKNTNRTQKRRRRRHQQCHRFCSIPILVLIVIIIGIGIGIGVTGIGWWMHNMVVAPLPANAHTDKDTLNDTPVRLRRESSVQELEVFSNHTHAIPNILIFTHCINLLTYDDNDSIDSDNDSKDSNTTAATPDKNKDDQKKELSALKHNVEHAISLHPGATVRFLSDDDCVASIQAVMGDDTVLVEYFINETTGMYKADLCRGAALWETGGIYLDVDLGVRMNLFDVLDPVTNFATVKVHLQSKHTGAFFQAFIGATVRNPIIYVYCQLFQDYYQGLLDPPLPNGAPVGVLLLRRAYDQVLAGQAHDNVDEEHAHDVKKDDSPSVNSVVTEDTVEIWQELLYLPRFQNTILSHVPPPVWGTRRACKFVVIATPFEEPFVVPFYSRVANSRMCPEQPPGEMGIYATEEEEEEEEEAKEEEEEEESKADGEDSSDGEEKEEE